MRDPFTFDPARIRSQNIGPFEGGSSVYGKMPRILFTYELPTGEVLEHCAWANAGGAGCGLYPSGLDPRAYPLFSEFGLRVNSLSAHQRLAWMAAAKKGVDDA